MKKIFSRLFSMVLALIITCGILVYYDFGTTVYALSNEQIIYNFLRNDLSLNIAASCGVLANIEKESGFRENALEVGWTWETGAGYGICQWTNNWEGSIRGSTGRRTELINWCKSHGYDYTSLTGQLQYLKYELNTAYYNYWVYSKLKAIPNNSDGAYEAGRIWCYYFEVPDGYVTVSKTRGQYAKDKYWPKYTGEIEKNDEELNIPYPRPTGTSYLQMGDNNRYTGWLQTALNRAINAGLNVDCEFGQDTYNAVVTAQRKYGLGVDGVVGSETINKLVSVLLDMMKPKTCIVSFNANGGSCGTGSKTVTIGNTYGDLPSASRIGYAFAGWFTEASGGSQVTASTSVIRSENHTLYAHWNVNSYTISFNGNGGTPNQNSKSVAYDSTYGDLPSATRTGYTLVGWFTESGGGNQISASTSMTRAENHTLYAHWSANPVIVKLNPNSGTVSSETIQLYYDGKYAGLPEATRTGYNFNGWYTSADGGTQVDANTVVNQTSEHTLYAHWSKDKFLITFDAKGGTAEAVSKLVSYDNSYGVLPNAEKSGYIFDGWYFDEQYTTQLTPDTKVQITGNQTFYAKWSLKQYIVTFDANGGSVEVQSKKVTYGKTYGVLPTPEKKV